eukprot:CAMPEP_0174737910 /NCGR_PEP_ID=MMETSP1094-20130205/69054_1 /TAXON_ID=156173 /ORGANISM="Chrysochromulina brevifilum, Strain UTEX LB 985" /LENGTH=56 /DNA_ID=CAMNT_0015941215 /DNA_START=228 /DNA_END=398 /DNA_ORIENTATION=+
MSVVKASSIAPRLPNKAAGVLADARDKPAGHCTAHRHNMLLADIRDRLVEDGYVAG